MASAVITQPRRRLQRSLELWRRGQLAAQRARRWVSLSVDHLTAFASCLLHLGICLYFARFGFNDFGADGQQFKTALDIAEGGVVCRDTWTQYGVLTHYLHAGALLLLGKKLLSIKYYTCVIYCLMTYAQFFVLRRFLPWSLAVLTAVAWIGVAPHYVHAIIPWPHVDALLFLLLSLLCLFRFIDREMPRYLVLAGILTGLSWAAKQSVGAYHFAALCAFLLVGYLLPGFRPVHLARLAFWRRSLLVLGSTIGPLLLGFTGVVVLVLLGLAWTGALHDWWAQTIIFARAYYLDFYLLQMPSGKVIASLLGNPAQYGPPRQFLALLIAWYQDSINNPVHPLSCGRHWLVIWLAAVLLGLQGLFRTDRESRAYALMGLVAGTSYLGTVPSMNSMHQWWTLTPAFGLLGAFFLLVLRRSAPAVRWGATTGLLLFFFVAPVCTTLSQIPQGRTATITQVPALKGMRTTPATATTVEQLYQAVMAFRLQHPDTKLITLDNDAFTLLFLPCLEHNRNFHPIYFWCPVLTDKVYPDYCAEAARYLRQEQPLVVASRLPGVSQAPLLTDAGYRPVFEINQAGSYPFSLLAPVSAPPLTRWCGVMIGVLPCP
jgi:hypothetical protein